MFFEYGLQQDQFIRHYAAENGTIIFGMKIKVKHAILIESQLGKKRKENLKKKTLTYQFMQKSTLLATCAINFMNTAQDHLEQ